MPKYYVQVKKSSGATIGYIPSKKNATLSKVRKEITRVRKKGLRFKILTETQFKRLFMGSIVKKIKTRLKARLKKRGSRRVVKRRKR